MVGRRDTAVVELVIGGAPTDSEPDRARSGGPRGRRASAAQPSGLSRGERSQMERAQERGYLVSHARRPNLYRAFFQWCVAERQPCVIAHTMQRYSYLKLDMTPA